MKEQEFLNLIEMKKESLYRIAYSYSNNREDALDVVQETMYKAYISLDKLKEKKFFHTWMISILIHTAIDHVKKNKKYVSLFDESLPEESSRVYHDEMIDLQSALSKLDEKHRAVIVLKLLEDMTFIEVARTLGQPESTVKSCYGRAIKKLKLEMEER